MSVIILHGIHNCDTVKKARRWLGAHDIDYQFHDFRKDGIDQKMLKGFLKDVDWETLLNKRGTTWRKLPENQKQDINQIKVIKLMCEQPAMIKRPVLKYKNKISVGFSEESYKELFL